MNPEDPPGVRVVVRYFLGGATLVALAALVVASLASRRVVWQFVALTTTLWAAYGFWDAILGGVVEPLGRFFAGQLTGDAIPGGTGITIDIDQETAMLERLLASDPPPAAHRAILAGVRLAEIYRTHQHDAAKADALVARLAREHPGAPELSYVAPPPRAGG